MFDAAGIYATLAVATVVAVTLIVLAGRLEAWLSPERGMTLRRRGRSAVNAPAVQMAWVRCRQVTRSADEGVLMFGLRKFVRRRRWWHAGNSKPLLHSMSRPVCEQRAGRQDTMRGDNHRCSD